VSGNEGIDSETEQRLQQMIANNCYQQQARRDQFIQTLVTLAWDSVNPQSASLWNRLPTEVIFLIFSFMDFRSTQSIGKSRKQVYYCATFILQHIHEIKTALHQGNRFTMREQLTKPISCATRFTLLFEPALASRQESAKNLRDAEPSDHRKNKKGPSMSS